MPVEPATRQDQFLSLVQRNRGFMGVEIVIAAANFGIDGPVLAAALTRYAANPEPRSELVKRVASQHRAPEDRRATSAAHTDKATKSVSSLSTSLLILRR